MPWTDPIFWVCIAAVALVGIGLGTLIGILYRKKVAERLIGSAEQKAKVIVEEGEKQAASAQKEAMLSAKRLCSLPRKTLCVSVTTSRER